MRFKQLFTQDLQEEKLNKLLLLEYEFYKRIPGTNNSYREDHGNINTRTLKHCTVYTKPGGKGNEYYSVNIDGTGHDGSSGTQIPTTHANFLRSIKGYNIPSNNILDSVNIDFAFENSLQLILLEEDVNDDK